jgi:hypothetical protein
MKDAFENVVALSELTWVIVIIARGLRIVFDVI